MGIHEYKLLSEVEQEELVLNCGVFLVTYTEETNLCDVYKVFKFYVKFCYDLTKDCGPIVIIVNSIDDFDNRENSLLQALDN